MLLVSDQLAESVRVVDVTIRVGDEQLGPHFQLHFQPFTKDGLRRDNKPKNRNNVNRLSHRWTTGMPFYPQLLFASLLIQVLLSQFVLPLTQFPDGTIHFFITFLFLLFFSVQLVE